MTTRLYLIRHGETALSAADCFSGASEAELSAEGRRQANCLAQRLAALPIVAFYCSPLGRARATATIVAAPHALTPVVVPDLRELDYGQWETLPREEVTARFAADYAAWGVDPLASAPPGGETGLDVLARVLPALRAIVQRHTGQSVAVVAHKAANRLALCGLLGIDPRSYRDRLDQSPACLNIVDFDADGQARLALFNDVSHYARGANESRAVGE